MQIFEPPGSAAPTEFGNTPTPPPKLTPPVSNRATSDSFLTELMIHGARSTYIEKLARHRMVPIFVSALMDRAMVDELYSITSGVLLMGGSDFEPALYRRPAHPQTSVREAIRDGLELYLLDRAIGERKPILGICRGCQALAVAGGGTLIQHVDTEDGPIEHSIDSYADLDRRPRHPVTLTPDSRVAKILGRATIAVNSAHHQAVDDPGPQFSIVGRSPDGVCEMIEHRDTEYFCFGIQSHPEAEDAGDLEPLFGAFAKACNQ